MAIKGDRRKTWIALVAALLLAGMVAGCGYDTRFQEVTRPLALSFAVTYTDRGSEVTVRYSLPPPDPGKTYVLWAYNQGRTQVAKLGPVQPGVERTAKGSTNFPIQGVIITQEVGPNVTRMEGTGLIELAIEDQNLGPTAGRGSGAASKPQGR